MPMFDFTCEVCDTPKRVWRYKHEPPRFCCRNCRNEGMIGHKQVAKWPITPEIRKGIERLYQGDTGNGQVQAFATKIGYPRGVVTKWAMAHGLVPRQRGVTTIWNTDELRCLEKHSRYSPPMIHRKMKKAGFNRSQSAIVQQLKKQRFHKNLDGQSAVDLALCLGVECHGVLRAIRLGHLKAERRGTGRTEAQGGDEHYIKDEDVREYILNHLAEIDFRKVDKYWLVDLLVNGGGR